MLIEQIIHQVWVGTKKIPTNLLKASKSWKKYNPDYKHLIHQNKDCVDLISKHYPQYLDIYEGLLLPVQKADLFRYIAVYHYGGIYTDMDTSAVKPLSDLISVEDTCIIGRDDDKKIKGRKKIEYLQWFFAARKKHPIFKEILNVIAERYQEKPCTIDLVGKDNYTYWLTGPLAFTMGIIRFLRKKDTINTLTIKDKCYFGNYEVYYNKKCLEKAVLLHHYDGSWKNGWENKDKKWYIPKNTIKNSNKDNNKTKTPNNIEHFTNNVNKINFRSNNNNRVLSTLFVNIISVSIIILCILMLVKKYL